MEKLSKDWITNGLIDFEYKKYILLAYLQHVKGNFDEVKLYPALSDLLERYQEALTFQKRKNLMKSGFPKEISRIDLEKIKVLYQEMIEDSDLMNQLEEIVEYALLKMNDTLLLGKEIYEQVEAKLKIEPIGIMPLYMDEGYLLMELGNSKQTDVYQYRVAKFSYSGEGYTSIYLDFLESIRRGIGDTFEGIKLQLIRAYKTLPNPATFLINSEQQFPVKETLMPITKRLVLQTVSSYR
ncbi:MAG: hypothetical protein COW03_06945 [Cytophagales bacterium CG12_big_fil_rev_8_21_14_0_65_40_12]|nr:MAG: hypothetical protein COW03_06945 [Cytophagales bacterium CG12_big_fil_rev_8_21_14_0_65_40_12]PIW02851.1 MAG: hypothetical protein COW40_17865 [Cytophagales bacterium CG17_big_fil_post_rev_8_21_14_2_50_40_13]